MCPNIAISIGDLNGIGLEIALKEHEKIKNYCQPMYCIDEDMLQHGAKLLKRKIPEDFITVPVSNSFIIKPSKISKKSGEYSFLSFKKAIKLAKRGIVDGIVTLPINKEAWKKAGINYVGHTDALRDIFKQEAIMMLGCEKLYVALYTEHIPLKQVAKTISLKKLTRFLLNLYNSYPQDHFIVLGLNPHAGDNGVMGDEETIISKAIKNVNKKLKNNIFYGPIPPDTAFTPHHLKENNRIVAIYHDQGLAPLKALYFDESINISLNLPIIRTSVDHGTAFDIAYKNSNPSTKSYINAIKAITDMV